MSYLIQVRSDTSANWKAANPILAVGEIGFATDTKDMKIGDGVTAWNSPGGPAPVGLPSGVISQFAGSTAPTGYLLCQGQTLSTTTYSNLFSVIGYTYGGSGANFLLPNLQNRIPVGRGSGTFANLNAQGGSETVTLTSSQIPAHSHPNMLSSNTVAAAGHVHDHINPIGLNSGQPVVLGGNVAAMSNMGRGFSTFAGSIQGSSSVNLLGNQSQNFEVWRIESSGNSANTTVGISNANNTGGDGAHTNLQPYIVVNYIIKT
jgi:microcystin-dependent protein